MTQLSEFTQFSLVHQLKRRVRIIAPSLFRDKERAYILQILLLKREAIEDVKIVSEINSVTIYFDPQLFPKQNLLNLLEIVLANFSQKPSESIKKIAQKSESQNKQKQKIVFGIGGMSCASCALFLEMVLSRETEAQQVSVNYVSETGTVNGYLTKAKIFKIVEENGYQAYSIDTLAERKILLESGHEHLIESKKQLILMAALGAPIILAGLYVKKTSRLRLLQAAFSIPAVFFGGKDIFKKSWLQARQGSMNMDTLVAIGAGSAITMSIPSIFNVRRHAYFDAATAIIGFVQIGRYLEELAKSKMIHEVESLVDMQPNNATLLKNGKEQLLNTEKVKVDDILLIRPGDRVPVDGVVISGLSSVDESMIVGSNLPVIKEKGNELFEGSINGSGVLKMQAAAIGKDTKLAGLVHMIDQAQSSKLHTQKKVDELSSKLMPAVMFLSVTAFTIGLLRARSVSHAFANAISVLVISCPCALGLATPAATSASSGQAAKRKVYIRNGNALEIMASVDTIIFDKTGTLTEGHAIVSEYINVSGLNDDYALQLAASVEFNSEHIFGKAIVDYAKGKKLQLLNASKFRSIPDQGVLSEVEGHEVLLGNECWIKSMDLDVSGLEGAVNGLGSEGYSLIFLVVDKNIAGLFALKDQIRTGVEKLIADLDDQGVDVQMVTGDTMDSAEPVANRVGIHSVIAQANPAKKIQVIRDLQSKGRVVAMIGDGVNDAPALAAANVSLVVGNASGIAIESADYVLVDGDIKNVTEVIEVSKQTLVVIKQNLFWAFAYNAIAIPVAMTGKLTPAISSATMALSSVSVILNSLRLRKK